MQDTIVIAGLVAWVSIGVPELERRTPQRITLWLRLEPECGLGGLGDELAGTVDYAAVAAEVIAEAGSRPRKLVETLADDIAGLLLARHPLRVVEVEVRKYILPGTEYVAVRIRREKAG